MFGFFSEIARRDQGSLIYATPDGREVEVTYVDYTSATNAEGHYDDSEPVGALARLVRVGFVPPKFRADPDRARTRHRHSTGRVREFAR